MARYFKVVIISVIALSLCGCDLIMWKRYSNPVYGFSISLPRFWQVEKNYQNIVLLLARAPSESLRDKFQANINITAGDLPEGAPKPTLDELFELNKEQLMHTLPGEKSNISEGEIFSGPNRGKWLSFDNQAKGMSLTTIVCVWLKGRRVYAVTCISETQKLPKYEPTFKAALRSLRLK